VAADTFVSEDAMGTFFNPIDNILTTTGPKETHANPKKGFVDTKVTADRAAMEDVEDKAAQGGGHNDKQQRGAGL
jgi:hypothetical protein